MDVQLSFGTGFMSVSPAVEFFFINVLSAQFRGHTEHRMVHRKTCVNSEITSKSSDVAFVDDIIQFVTLKHLLSHATLSLMPIEADPEKYFWEEIQKISQYLKTQRYCLPFGLLTEEKHSRIQVLYLICYITIACLPLNQPLHITALWY